MIRKISKRAWQFVMAIALLISQMGMLLSSMPYVAAEIPLATLDPTIKVTQNGCALKIEKTEEVKWELPRQPIDLVILQDTSGSFEDTISYVQSALKTLTKPVSLEDYDEKEPRLVFTGNKDTTDRVMINTFQGIDGSNYYYDSDFKIFSHLNVQQDGAYRYQYRNTELLTSETEINQFIDKFNTIGGTPTVPAIDDTIARYNSIKGDMKNNRKTIFLLITDGVANGFRSQNGQVLMDRSIERGTLLRNEFIREGVVDSQRYVPEAQQDYIKRAQELKEAGQRLEALVKSNDQNDKNDGAVIVGFWEDIKIFTTGSSYGTTYQDGSVFEKVGIDVGADKRSVQEVFHEALKSVATSEQYYVNEQANPQAFSDKILKAVTQALVKENVEGTFQITEGYKVDSVTINDKTVVENVTDEATQIQGKVTQNGTTVTISVPESVFNPGNNKFDYLLSRTEDVENIAEEDEEEPSDDYAPQQVERQVGQLTGTFKVGDYESAEIGSKEPTTVTVTDLKYCYPNVSKDVKDKDATNDLGIVDDPIIAKKKSYAANLTTDNETFTYKILYRMNNAPLEFDKNAMLVDRLDYRIAYKNAYVTDVDGNRIDKFTIKTKDVVDVATGQTQTVVYATIPEDPGVNTETIKEGQYGNHKFKRYYLVIEAQLKDEYSFDKNPDEYKKILQENDGLGLMNQATILWNGSEDPVDPNAKTRRSNTVYVLPPVKTDIKKDVQSVEGTTGAYVEGQEQLYLSERTQEYFYNVESVWPGLADSYILSDTLVPELEFVTAYGKGGAKITVNGNDVAALTNKLVVTGNTVKLELTKADFTGRTIARQIATANKGNNGPAVIKLTIKAKIKDGADLSKYAVGGQIKVPNKAQVELNGKPQESNEVYVTPDEPAPSKKINSTLDVLNTTKSDEAFEFNIQTKLPRDIQKYQSYKISDKLDNRLELTNQPAPYIKGDAAQYFDVTYDEARHTVVATAKTAGLASMTGGETVELVIPAKIKDGTAIEKIPNTATIFYQTPSSGGEKETPPTPPVHVTPPPTIDKKVNNETHYNLTEATEAFTYTIETQVPDGATSFVISDKLVDVLEFDGEKGGATVQINGTDVTTATTITAENKTLEVALSADQLKNNVGQKVLVTFKAKVIEGSDLSNYIKEGVAKVPNTASYIINTDPKTKKETKPVTVTPPGEASEPQKTVNDQQSAQLSNLEEVFTYKVTAQVPTNTAGFTKFELSDDLEDILTVTETSATAGDATLDQKVTVTSPEEANTANGNVTASLSSNDIAKFAGKTVTLTIKARLKEGVTAEELAKYVTADNVAGSIPNRATLTVGDKPNQTKESENVPVTPPSETPSITKKINGNLEHLDTETATDYSYNIKVKVPADITSYKKFVIRDELNADLAIQGTPVISEPATQYFDVKVEGQLVTATMKNFAAAQELAGKEVELVIVSQIRKGVTTQNIPNTAEVVYQNRNHVEGTPDGKNDTPPVTVTPPGEDPTVEKKINRDLTEAVVLPESNYTYNITSTLPVDITSYKAYAIVDELDENLSIQGTPVVTGDAAKFFDVTVTGNTVKATMKDFKQAKDLAGKQVELVITAQVKSTSTATKIDNTAKVTYQNKNHVDGEPDSETPPTPPVTVTTPPVTKKINENLDHLDTATQTNYTYNIKTVLPTDIATYKRFVITDSLEGELAVQGIPTMTGDAAKFFDVKVDGQVVTATITDFEAAKAMAGKEVELVIVSQIRKGVTTQNIPNTAEVVYQNRNHVEGTPDGKNDTPPVTVTPPGEDPTVEKKINRDLTEAVVLPESNYTYNITSTLPVDITSYKAYAIVDELDENLSIQGTPVVTGDAAKFFDVTVTGNTVKATMKDFKQAKDLAGKQVELVITAQVKSTSTATKIDNTAKVTYQNKNHVDGEPDSETPPTPPVTVTTPPVTKKINENLDHLDTATQTNYTYNIKTVLPTDIATYKRFVITDSLEGELAVQGIPTMTGDAAKFFDVKVDGQVVTATITDFEAAKAMAGKEVELVIVSQIREGVTRQAIPNQTTISYTNKAKADGTPGDVTTTPPTPPVTVTPPGETPTVEKKINRDLTEAVVLPESNYTYNITSTLPVDITSYKAYAIVDELDENLSIQGTPVVTGDAAKFFDVTVTGNTVKATMKDFKQAKDLAGKQVELVITAQVKATSTAAKIDNTAKVTYQNKNHVDGEPDSETPPTPPVTVTTPPVTKKINESLDHLDTATQTNYTYNIKTVLPTDIATYKRFVITDSLESELAVQGIPTMTGDAAKFFDVKVDGQVVTATITDFEAAKAMAGKEVELVIVSQIREGVTRQAIPNQTTISYTNKAKADGTPGDVTTTPPTPPVTVTPPGETPTVEKKINSDLTEAVVLPESNYTYNITSTLPVDITSYKAYAIVDELDENLSIQGTPVVTGDAAKFFDVTVTGNTVKATMKDFKQAKDLAGKQVELVITAQVKSTSTATKIDNTAKVTYQNKNHVDGEPDSETPPTPPVTVTTPPVTKKINENLDHLDTATQTNYTYNIKTVLPTDIATYKRFVITDSLEGELAVQGIPTMTGDAAKFFDVKVDGQVVTATITDFEAAKAMAGKEVELVIVSQIREGVTRQAIPNQTTISYTNKAKADGTPGDVTTTPPTPPVTVTPPGETPTVEKKINRDLTEAVVLPESNYTYNITSTLPVDITSYKAYAIVDELDENLSIQGTPVVTGDAAKFFDVTVTGNTVKATMKDFKQAKDLAGKQVELVITAQVKSTSTATKIDNTAKVTYQNKNHVDGEPDSETPPTPPVTVTTPPVTKKINENLDHLDTATQTNYTYNIKTVLPTDIATYKRFVITDSLEGELAVQGIPTMTGDAAKFFDVKVDGQVVTATITDFEAAKAMAGKEVELVIVSQIREGVTRQAIPNQTTISYTNKAKADGTPGDVTTTPPTPPVTVTPPGETPTVEKKINRDLEHLDIETEKDYNYNITTNLPVDIVSYKRYVLTDTLDQDLAIQGTPVITGEAAKFFDVTVEGQTVTATMKDFKQAKDLAGKQVELVITAQVREGITRPNIPNTAKVGFTNKSDQTGEKETKPVTVTPPTPNTPPIEKKVNGAASAELASRQEVFTYTIDTVVPTGAFAFEVNDTLEDVLAFEGEVTATLAGKALSTNQITVAGQTVTVKLTKEQVRQQAGAPLQVVFFAKVKDGADLTPYMTDGRTSVPNTASYIINNDPSTKKDSNTVPVYPPTPNEPSVDKKINRDLTHLDVEVNKSYMYNVTADLPQDIATYKEFVVTDIVEPVLAINGEVVAYVDGYATDAVKVTVEGNRVVASVVDFSRLAGFKQIQLYIPAYIKSDADLTAYMKDNAASIPNTASLDFTDSNGVKKRKETTPVTVTPPTPDTPPTPPVNPPQPGTPVKTVSRVAGLEQTDYLALLLATENFRFDIKSVVPMDEADDKRLNLTSLTITDQMDNLFTVSPDKVAVKVTNAPTANANYIDEDVEKAQAALDVEVAKLEEIKQSAQTDTSAAALTEAQNLLATLEAEWTAAEAKLAELTTAELTEAPVETPAVDYASEIAAQEALMAELQAKLDEAKTQVQTAQAALSTAKTAAEVKVEVENQEKVVAEKQTVLDEAKKRQAMVQERIAQLANVNEKGELTAQAIVALGGSIKVEGQLVTVDFTDEYTMEALKGYTVNVIIYSSISDVDALTKDHFTIGIDNTATVQFNHDPSEQLTKKTNKVTVVPPKNDTPPPPPTTPEKPKGELPTPPTPPTTPPAESTPPPPGKTLPKTGVAENGMYALVGMILGTLTLVFRRRKQ
ncbi:isopeptide-forming domain-containing fimbrial protein [Streptococcus suis]|uniref:isopeptide-forming domain-containing fimbrial protein n=2 Tax=Streptococcus suis TaxID=1307 RepID=UPI00211C68D4|nr:isopeptide-forming domain-containing fimbrial protein [Streptococcus suis]UUM45605.1 isopeptide-forming domain-containing fimbrial protein [Streptococcus suis]